jgi:hypothetical protein
MTNVREFTNDELQTLSSTHGGVAEQNMSYGICIKVDGHIVKWLTFQAAEQCLHTDPPSALPGVVESKETAGG